MNNYTKGPWKARHTPGRSDENKDIWCIDWSQDQEEVAEIVHGEANARLMAAAPELLSACCEALDALTDLGLDFVQDSLEEQICARVRLTLDEAINKAKGEL